MKKINFLNSNKNYLGLKQPNFNNSKVIIVPFGLEKTVTYGKGTKNGPGMILDASHQLELYDDEFKKETYMDFNPLTLKINKIPLKLTDSLNYLSNTVEKILSVNKFPLILGGEHTITSACIKPFVAKNKELLIIHFDAHTDLRNTYEKNINSHACVMRRCLDHKNVKIISLGIRSTSANEIDFINKNKSRIKIFWAKNYGSWDINELIKLIKNKKIYITFDVDVFDPSIMASTGTPEPGGLEWNFILKLLRKIIKNSQLLGVDINELAPIKNLNSCNFLVSKLVYKILSYKFSK